MELIDKNKLHNTLLFMESIEDLSYGKKIYDKVIQQVVNMPTTETKSKRDFEVVVNEACLNCELDCVEVVRCHDCKNHEEAKNGVNGFCKEWQTSTYTWEWCARGERRDEVEE